MSRFLSLTALFAAGFATAFSVGGVRAAALGTTFSYQGRLLNDGAPTEGMFDFRFTLFNGAADGVSVAMPLTNSAVLVSNGLFMTVLDFGTNVFSGAAGWLEIGVRPVGAPGDFVTLAPRQALRPVPYSIYTVKAESLNGAVPDSQLSTNVARLDGNQIFTGAITFNGQVVVGSSNAAGTLDVLGAVRASSFAGDAAGLSNVVATALSAKLVERFWRVSIPFVNVTNPGNAPDVNGKGAVPYSFRIGRFEVNNNQYAAFLNAVAAEDPNGLYSTNMATTMHGGIERSGMPGEFFYAVKPEMGHRPVVWVDFRDALRFCNWLHHGQPAGPQDSTTTEDGAYTLTPEALASNTVSRNPHARFWIPNDDEWYKAAYHQPWGSGGEPGDYWEYPTRSNDAPISEPPPGGPNSANACCDTGMQATDLGAYRGASSFYGTFDQAGNVEEWTEEIVFITNRRLRGGSWIYNEFYSRSSDFEFDTIDYDSEAIGIRVAGALEP